MRVKVSRVAELNAETFICPGDAEKVLYLDTSGIKEGKIIGLHAFTADEKLPSRAKRAVQDGTIVLSTVRPNLKHYGILRNPPSNLVVSTGFVTVDANESLIDSAYLYYAITSKAATAHLARIASTSVSSYPSFNPSDLGDYEIEMPAAIEKQREVAEILVEIDARISNNDIICRKLDAVAQLIYKYWFAQFDYPDEDSKPYKTSGGKMVWNGDLKREIPEGWNVASIKSCIAKSKNGDWGNESPECSDDIEVKCFRGADFPSITDNYQVAAPVRFISAMNEDRLLANGDLITEVSGGSPVQSTGRIGYINQMFLERNGGLMDCSNFCKAFTPIDIRYQFWLYQTWRMLYDMGVMFNYESKTTGLKNLMFDEFVDEVKVPIPPKDLLDRYQGICSSLYERAQEAFIESAELADIRDFLLPMLMNGQAKVAS